MEISMTLLEYIKAYDIITSHGWLHFDEGALLIGVADKTEGSIVEVGCYQGRSAMLLAQLERPLHCVDPWDDSFSTDYKGDRVLELFLSNMKGLAVKMGPRFPSVIVAREKVEDWKPVEAGFVYLDGDHTYKGTKAQIEKALACHPQAIAIHDCNDRGEGANVKRAALELLGPYCQRMGAMAVWYGTKGLR